ncbi:MAG: ABC transporter permease [Magnetococcales bacterium]|nr:ABC transporter permease [Magnetococcales bacterium]
MTPSKPQRAAKKQHRRVPVWMILGWRAWIRSIMTRTPNYESGDRDFAWVTLLLTLVLTLALLAVGSRTGFLDRLTDTLLGVMPPHGAPVWITAHWQNHDGIRQPLLQQLTALELHKESSTMAAPTVLETLANHPTFKSLLERPAAWPEQLPWPLASLAQRPVETVPDTFRLQVHPYRVVGNNSPTIRLPHSGAWSRTLPFGGWAVYEDHPLWRMALNRTTTPAPWLGLPLQLVANETLFERYFDYDRYRDGLNPLLSQRNLPQLPAKSAGDTLPKLLTTLWLMVDVAHEEQLLPFSVRWVRHIPAIDKPALLFPLTTYHALLAAHHLPELHYQPERSATAGPLPNAQLQTALLAFNDCVQRELSAAGLSAPVKIRDGVCPRPADLASPPSAALAASGKEKGQNVVDLIHHDSRNNLWLPCHRLPRNETIRTMLCPEWPESSNAPPMLIPWDATGYGSPFTTLQIFIPETGQLNRVIDQIGAMRTAENLPAFSVLPTYHDALSRFNLLHDLLDRSVPAYAMVFLLLLGTLLFAQIGSLLDHRRTHYGMLLSRGLSWRSIHAKLLLQMLLSMTISSAVAVGVLLPLLRWFIGRNMIDVLASYQSLLPPGQSLNFMPLEPREIVATVMIVLLALLSVTFVLAWRLPLRGSTVPSALLHGGAIEPPA